MTGQSLGAPTTGPLAAYDVAILAEAGLQAYYLFADNFSTKTAASVRDSKGSAHGQATGAATTGLGAFQGLGLYVAGSASTGDYVDFGDVFDQTGTAAFSFEFLIRRDGGAIGNGTQCYPFGKEDGTTAGSAFDAYMVTERLNFRRFDSAGATDTISSPNGTFTPGVRRHVGITYDGANLRMYIDGIEVAGSPVASTRSVQNVATTFRIGVIPSASAQCFQGMFGRFAVYSVALSATVIANHAALAPLVP